MFWLNAFYMASSLHPNPLRSSHVLSSPFLGSNSLMANEWRLTFLMSPPGCANKQFRPDRTRTQNQKREMAVRLLSPQSCHILCHVHPFFRETVKFVEAELGIPMPMFFFVLFCFVHFLRHSIYKKTVRVAAWRLHYKDILFFHR